MTFFESDKHKVIERYSKRYNEFGYSPKTLGWDKGKQDIRFDILSSFFELKNSTILDIGCGFGDLNILLGEKINQDYSYIGIDIVPVLIEEAQKRFNSENIEFMVGDFLETEIKKPVDIALASGIFNFKLDNSDNYKYIENVMRKAFEISKTGLAFDFLSDQVDYQYEHTFHSNPGKILELAYSLSRNVVLRNDYMPFEFSVCIYKDDSFSKEDTVFDYYKKRREYNNL